MLEAMKNPPPTEIIFFEERLQFPITSCFAYPILEQWYHWLLQSVCSCGVDSIFQK